MIKIKSFPKNKKHFMNLIPFVQKIISICKKNRIDPIIYGSFSHFVHTEDKSMIVNDIDMIIPKKAFPKIARILSKEKFKVKYYPSFSDNGMSTIIVKKGDLKVEVDQALGYRTVSEKTLNKNIFDIVDFYRMKVRMITLKQLEEIYVAAYHRSKTDKKKILKKIRHLEKFLGRRIKSKE